VAARTSTRRERLAEAFERAGAAHQLFISSYSAHPAAVTEYGTSKLAGQRLMRERDHAVARLGIAIGPGGIYLRMRDALTAHRVVPLIGGGRDRVPIVAIHDLTEALTAIAERRLAGTYNLFNPELVALREVLLETRAASRSRASLVSVPFALVVPPLWLARQLGVALPLDIDNVRAMRANQTINDRSDLPIFVPKPMTLAEMVRAAASG
jgi:nucleoside-diphosphate-sugar epimerase